MEAMEVDIVEKIVASHLMRTILSSSERMAWSTCHPLVRCCSMKLILMLQGFIFGPLNIYFHRIYLKYVSVFEQTVWFGRGACCGAMPQLHSWCFTPQLPTSIELSFQIPGWRIPMAEEDDLSCASRHDQHERWRWWR